MYSHERDEAAYPVGGCRGVDTWQHKKAGMRASASSNRSTGRTERPQGGRSGPVHNPVKGTQGCNAAAMSERLELSGLCVAEELGSLGLHSVEQSKRCRRSTEPDRAAVLEARAHVRLVYRCELGARDDMASTVQMANGLVYYIGG